MQVSLRNEARHGAIAIVGMRHIAGAEPELVATKVEERGLREVVIRTRSELVTCTVGMELFPLNEAFGMGKRHGADSESTETELFCRKAFTSTTHGATTVTHSELGRHDQDVTLLLFNDLLE